MTWVKDKYFWRKPLEPWQITNYNLDPDVEHFTKGDLISNTCRRIRELKDQSKWAGNSLFVCWGLLYARKRWPDIFNEAIDAKTIIGWRWSQLLQRTGINKTVKYRPQHHQTRDGYIYYLSAHMVYYNYCDDLTIPWYLYRPHVWAWKKYLIKPNKWSAFIYKLGDVFTLKKTGYRGRLSKAMSDAYNLKKKDENKGITMAR